MNGPHDVPVSLDPESRLDTYLDASVRTATPARLRLMLLERALTVSDQLIRSWEEGSETGPNEYSTRLLELLGELLDGVKGSEQSSESEVCEKVADLYVFLVKHLVAAEETSDRSAIEEIRTVLAVETETWRAACAGERGSNQVNRPADSPSEGLNISA